MGRPYSPVTCPHRHHRRPDCHQMPLDYYVNASHRPETPFATLSGPLLRGEIFIWQILKIPPKVAIFSHLQHPEITTLMLQITGLLKVLLLEITLPLESSRIPACITLPPLLQIWNFSLLLDLDPHHIAVSSSITDAVSNADILPYVNALERFETEGQGGLSYEQLAGLVREQQQIPEQLAPYGLQ